MRAVVNDAIHVEVEIVECGYAVGRDELGREGIPLGDPAEEFGDTWSSVGGNQELAYPW